jgi:diguanylate cyclase (GGDEF)-like protein
LKLIKKWMVVFTTLLPVVIEQFILKDQSYVFTWTLLLIPAVLMMPHHPNWKTIWRIVMILLILPYGVVFFESTLTKERTIAILLSMGMNVALFLFVSNYRIRYATLLKKTEELTLVDPLTGIYNRRYLQLYMEKALPYLQKTGQPFFLAVLDMDHFKAVNDQYGHDAGDKVLQQFSKIVSQYCHSTDTLVRMGGEEFALLLSDTTEEEGEMMIELVRKEVNNTPIFIQQESLSISVSIGGASYEGETVESFMKRADSALYEAKNNGRNRCVIKKNSNHL